MLNFRQDFKIDYHKWLVLMYSSEVLLSNFHCKYTLYILIESIFMNFVYKIAYNNYIL